MNREQALLDRDPKLARDSLYNAYLQNGECETSAKILTERAFLKHPLKALVEEKYGIEYEEFTNPWHAAASSFPCFFCWFPSSNALDHSLSNCLSHSGDGLRCWTILNLHWLYQCELGKAPTKQAMLRNLIIGLLTMGVTYFFGQLFSILKS